MTKEQIQKAFEGRWRINGFDDYEVRQLSGREVNKLCRDFFETGILLGEGFQVADVCDDKGKQTGQIMIYKHDPILDTADSGFSEWWNLYDKKIDRAKCERKWNKLTLAERKACIAATPAYVASTPDLQFRRHPMTYLNNKSWENQIIPHNNAANTKPSIEQQRLSKLASILTE